MKRIKKLATPPRFVSYSAIGGYEEKYGPLGSKFDFTDETDSFGKKTWELSEAEMERVAVNIALTKANMSHEDIGLLVAGDLQNQCVASSQGLDSFGIPFLGIYGACSTCTEGLVILSSMLSEGYTKLGMAVTSSHNSAAERQFRTPVEYGGQRAPSAQWTATASGAFILSTDDSVIAKSNLGNVEISEVLVGKIVDGATKDSTNMGGAMAFAAATSLLEYFEESEYTPGDFDLIVTGDLGRVGSDILKSILEDKLPSAAPRHTDCGLLLYDTREKDVHSGASGCGASASVLACHLLPMLESGELKRILFMSTGALMSQSSILQGTNIKAVAPIIHLCNKEKGMCKNE